MSMARLWQITVSRNKLAKPLAPIYNWFTEGFDTLDLKEVKAAAPELA
jgi:hypothetical protein